MIDGIAWSLVLVQLPSEPSRHRVAVWRELRRGGAVPIGSGTWLLPDREPFVSSLGRAAELAARGGGTFAVIDASPKDEAAADVLRAAFAAARLDEWSEFEADCGKFEAEIDREFAKEKFTLGELEEEEQSLDRLRRWFATLQARDALELPEAQRAAQRLAGCERRADEYAEQVYRVVQGGAAASGTDLAADRGEG
jgi:hypothetical protein